MFFRTDAEKPKSFHPAVSRFGQKGTTSFMDFIATVNATVNSIVWGTPMLIALLGTGLYLTVRTDAVQLRRFGYAMQYTLGKILRPPQNETGAVSPFHAVTTALAATVGTGNIVGITWAVTMGGPGSIFWMWVSALIGMCTKYAEVLLAVRYRRRNAHGDWVGGPMYYIADGLGMQGLAALFSGFGALAAFGIGNAVQVGSITDAIRTAVTAFDPTFSAGTTLNFAIGIAVAAITAFSLLGGIRRLGSITALLVPVMAAAYVAACVTVLIVRMDALPDAFRMIFQGAFSPASAAGGASGFTLKLCMEWGIKRGVFSNEAGLGSAPIAHAATSETNPVAQGLYGIFEVFLDTIVLCTISGLTLLVSGIDLHYGTCGTTALNAQALGTVFGQEIGALIIAVGITLFALATVLSWGLYGSRCWEYLFGSEAVGIYCTVYVCVTVIGAVMDLELAWEIADTLNGLMALPNLIALLGLSPVVAKLTREYFRHPS